MWVREQVEVGQATGLIPCSHDSPTPLVRPTLIPPLQSTPCPCCSQCCHAVVQAHGTHLRLLCAALAPVDDPPGPGRHPCVPLPPPPPCRIPLALVRSGWGRGVLRR